MKTAVKNFDLSLLVKMIDSGDLKNTFTNKLVSHSIIRFELGIEQEIIYGIEQEDGSIELLPNDVLAPLLVKLTISEDPIYKRKLLLQSLKICILAPGFTNEEEIIFKLITNKD